MRRCRGRCGGKDRYGKGADIKRKIGIQRTENKLLEMIVIIYCDEKYLYTFWRTGNVEKGRVYLTERRILSSFSYCTVCLLQPNFD